MSENIKFPFFGRPINENTKKTVKEEERNIPTMPGKNYDESKIFN